MQQTIGFIGTGNMAQSIALGLLKQAVEVPNIIVFSPSAANKDWITKHSIQVASSIQNLLNNCDILILATKPQQVQQALKCADFSASHCLISVAAGISTEFLCKAITSAQAPHIIRAMPNTPSRIGKGICGLYAIAQTRNRYATIAETIFSAIGSSVWLDDEALMDVVTAVSGSGPAYYFLIVENMISAAVELGLDQQTASKLAIETLFGAASLLKSTNLNPTLLRQQVTSKGGTTAAALDSFANDNLHTIIFNALQAATDKGTMLNQQALINIQQTK